MSSPALDAWVSARCGGSSGLSGGFELGLQLLHPRGAPVPHGQRLHLSKTLSRGEQNTQGGCRRGEICRKCTITHTHHKGNQERCMYTHAHRYKTHNQKQSVDTRKVAQVNLTIITLNDNAQRCWTQRLQCTSHSTWCIQGDWKIDREREGERGKQSANGERKVPVGFSFESRDWFAETSERMVGEFRQFADRPSNPIISHCTKVALLFFTVSLESVMLQCPVNMSWQWGSKIHFSYATTPKDA